MVRSIRGSFPTLSQGATRTMWALNFVIESALFNDFLHEEAIQLASNTLKAARKYLDCQSYKYLYDRAVEDCLATGISFDDNWGWVNPWSDDTFQWLFQDYKQEFDGYKPDC